MPTQSRGHATRRVLATTPTDRGNAANGVEVSIARKIMGPNAARNGRLIVRRDMADRWSGLLNCEPPWIISAGQIGADSVTIEDSGMIRGEETLGISSEDSRAPQPRGF